MGRARRLARDEEARLARKAVLDVPLRLVSLAACMDAADDLVGSAKEETEAATEVLDGAETDALKNSLGVGARGPGVVAASRGSAGQLKELERRQKSRATRIGRDSLDRALVDLAGLYRDAMVLGRGARGGAAAQPPRPPRRRRRAGPPDRPGGGAAADRRDPRLPDGAGAERQAADRAGGAHRGPATARLSPGGPAPDGRGGAVVCAGTSAALAQSVEHLTRNEKVVGSIPTGGSPGPVGLSRVPRDRRPTLGPRPSGAPPDRPPPRPHRREPADAAALGYRCGAPVPKNRTGEWVQGAFGSWERKPAVAGTTPDSDGHAPALRPGGRARARGVPRRPAVGAGRVRRRDGHWP